MPINYQLGKIYLVINDVNDTIYVGSTAVPRLCTRMAGHRADAKEKTSTFYTAMRALGTDHFRIVLDHAFPCNSKDELVAEEMKTLDAHIAAGKSVYNSVIGGKPNKEVREKMAAAHIGAVIADETKRKIAKAQLRHGCISMYSDKKNTQRWLFAYEKTCRSFSCKKYGFWQAKLLAEAERKRVYPEWKSDEEVATEGLMAIELD